MLITSGSLVKDKCGNIYTLNEMIGNGGFGNVYKAHRQTDNKIFAVKTLLPAFETPDTYRSFQNEIEQAALVKSEYVIHYEYAHDGTAYEEYPPYIIMEYANEGTLFNAIEHQSIKKEFFTNDFLMQAFFQLANGMNTINKVLIHRDIKPENILIKDGNLKISDFGLSKLSGESTRMLTFKGFGTARYVAPEAWNNDKNTIQMDIYSMGLVFYELATLKYPYNIQNGSDIMMYRNAHLFEAPLNPSKINSALPPNIVSIIVRMLEKPTQKRFSNWTEIIAGLQIEATTTNDMYHFVEQAVRFRNESDILAQKQKAEKNKQEQEKRDFCQLVYSQFNSMILNPIRQFAEDFNMHYSGSSKLVINSVNGYSPSPRFSANISFPSGNNVWFDFEAILLENHTREVLIDRIFGDEGYRTEHYIPQCNKRNVLAWGQVKDSTDIGFNLILLDAEQAIYGDWFILINTNSGFSRSRRPEPFGFDLNELPEEIELIKATHIYNSDLKPLDIQYVLQYISERV